MLPKLRIILTTVIAACAAVLVISAGLVATREPGERLTGVPSMSQPLVQQAIVRDTELQHFRLLAYSRRADELARLRDLPTAPARAVVEYAERAKKADEAASAPVPIVVAPAPTIVALAPAPMVVATAPIPAPSEPPPAVSPIAPPPAQPAPATVASAPAAAPPPDEPAVPASAPAAAPAEPPTAPAAPALAAIIQPAAAPSPAAPAVGPAAGAAGTGGGTQVANLPSVTDATQDVKADKKPAEKPAAKPADAKPHHRAKGHARKEPHKKTAHVARTQAPSNTVVPAAAQTGFPLDLPKRPAQATPSKPSTLSDSRQDTHQD